MQSGRPLQDTNIRLPPFGGTLPAETRRQARVQSQYEASAIAHDSFSLMEVQEGGCGIHEGYRSSARRWLAQSQNSDMEASSECVTLEATSVPRRDGGLKPHVGCCGPEKAWGLWARGWRAQHGSPQPMEAKVTRNKDIMATRKTKMED
ncbi:hypothetical protein AAFF_G00349940 [Aldrovandia affinis]|uniref:Uncharacterized protein n=1 Tax=Aldrovandia affinis TaxID=143900 RepID=A0AAD7SJY4_9TELE|nr:hypothetical protein AAFF_G00349940 [Aldrovandia affinis]